MNKCLGNKNYTTSKSENLRQVLFVVPAEKSILAKNQKFRFRTFVPAGNCAHRLLMAFISVYYFANFKASHLYFGTDTAQPFPTSTAFVVFEVCLDEPNKATF